MTDQITAEQFHQAEGVDDWRVVFAGAGAHFTTGSFANGVALVDRIGALADAANHHPDVDLRYSAVAVRLISHDVGGLSKRDVALAQQISSAAKELGIGADPSMVQTVQVAIDAHVSADVMPFWRAVLGYSERGDEDLDDPRGSGPSLWFQQMRQPRTGRNRIHVDVSVPHDQARARVDAAIAAGGRLLNDKFAPAWWTLADAEGNEVDVASWQGRD
jgi:4a-hydroxytetrahydrobiopterin dehydratase